jgi:hypothetical protein
MVRIALLGMLWTIATASPASGQSLASEPTEHRHVGAGSATHKSIPAVAEFYMLPVDVDGGPRVKFVQEHDKLSATWMTADGAIYGVGTYLWDSATASFNGTSTTVGMCPAVEGRNTFVRDVLVREELYVVNEHELLDRWTKPLRVDCSVGRVEVFKWYERHWIAADEDWNPLQPPAEP